MATIQQTLVGFYALDEIPDVAAFVRVSADGGRERLLVRDGDDGVEVTLELPPSTMVQQGELGLDAICQLVEGVSHFVLVAERARRELPTTQLELELQAEIDKYVVLAVAVDQQLDRAERAELHGRLFAGGFVDPPGSERGERYRLAHELAMRFTYRLEVRYLARGRIVELRDALRRFYGAGPSAKLDMARAA